MARNLTARLPVLAKRARGAAHREAYVKIMARLSSQAADCRAVNLLENNLIARARHRQYRGIMSLMPLLLRGENRQIIMSAARRDQRRRLLITTATECAHRAMRRAPNPVASRA